MTTASSSKTAETYFVLREKTTGCYVCEEGCDSVLLIADVDLLRPDYPLYRVWDGARDARLVHMDRSPAMFETAARETIDEMNKLTKVRNQYGHFDHSDFELVEIHATCTTVGDPTPVQ